MQEQVNFTSNDDSEASVEALRDEVSQWREKWQTVTESLDAQATVVASKEADQNNLRTELDDLRQANGEQDQRLKDQDLELTGLRESAQSLEGRNQKLFETTEMANRQIEALGESLGQLRDQVREKDERLAEFCVAREEMETEAKTLTASLDDERKEIKRLEDCVARAESITDKRDVERRHLSDQMAELKSRNQHLEAQLAERSNLVVGLEQEKTEIDSKTSSLESENVRLSKALEKAQHNSGENAEHVAQLDSKLERKGQLMEDLEGELVQVQNELAASVKE